MARNQERNAHLKDERRKQILEEARVQFATKGLAATKISDIATALGISQGLIYHYFASKEEIFVELIRDAFEKISTAALELEKLAMPPQEKIKTALIQLLNTIEQSEAFAKTCLLIAQATISTVIPEEANKIIADMRDIPYRAIANILREGQKEKTIKNYPPDELALVFWTIINGLATYRATHDADVSLPDATIFLHMFLEDKNGEDENAKHKE